MGKSQSKEVPARSPLGCILAHWRDIAGEPGGTLSRKKKKILIKYCNQWWLMYKLEDRDNEHIEGCLCGMSIKPFM